MYRLQLEGKDRNIVLFIPGTLSDEDWKDKITASEKRYQEFKDKGLAPSSIMYESKRQIKEL